LTRKSILQFHSQSLLFGIREKNSRPAQKDFFDRINGVLRISEVIMKPYFYGELVEGEELEKTANQRPKTKNEPN